MSLLGRIERPSTALFGPPSAPRVNHLPMTADFDKFSISNLSRI